MSSIAAMLQLVISILLAVQNNPAATPAQQQQAIMLGQQAVQAITKALPMMGVPMMSGNSTGTGTGTSTITSPDPFPTPEFPCPPNAMCARPIVPIGPVPVTTSTPGGTPNPSGTIPTIPVLPYMPPPTGIVPAPIPTGTSPLHCPPNAMCVPLAVPTSSIY